MSVEQMHWFLRERCNLERCAYCFGPTAVHQVIDLEQDNKLAKELVAEGTKMVVLGGGEPMLASNFNSVLQTLKEGGVYTSLHTNGLLLSDQRLDSLTGLVDEIALPIDTTHRGRQAILRGEGFMPVYDDLATLADKISTHGINLGWHTVFNRLNEQDMPNLYDFISQHDFNFWRIYEYNDDLARQGWIDAFGLDDDKGAQAYAVADALSKRGTPGAGGTDCLLADFLRAEEAMQKMGDKRVCFVARKDETNNPYTFLRSNGDVHYYKWSSTSKRRVLGNVLTDGLPVVTAKLEDGLENWPDIEEETEDWLEATADMPLWARLWDGIGFIPEELDMVEEKYIPEIFRLANLWLKRNGIDAKLEISDYYDVVV